MPTIEPPKFTAGEFNLPSGLGRGLANFGRNLEGPGGFGKKHLQNAMALQDQFHGHVMEHLNRQGEIYEQQQASAHDRAKELQSLTHEQSKEMETHKAGIASAASAQEHSQLMEAAGKKAEIDEAAAAGTHSRNLESFKAVMKAAQPGTKIDWRVGDTSASLTRKLKQIKAAETTAAPAPAAPSKPGASWAQTPAGATTLPITSKPVAPSGPQPSVGRNARGQATSLKPGGAKKPATKKRAKAVPAATGPMVGRNARGQATSLKKN